MLRKLTISFLALLLLCAVESNAQDPHFSQFYANPIYLNPAFAGTAICPRLIMNYRNQWPSITGSFVTYNASYDMYVKAISGGIGILATADKAGEGVMSTTTASGIYSVRVRVGREFYLHTGLQASFFQKSIDESKLTYGDQIDNRWGFVRETLEPKLKTENVSQPDFSAGLLGYSKNFYIGFAAHHLTEPNEAFNSTSELKMKFTGQIGGMIPLIKRQVRRPDDAVLSPNFIFMQQGNFHQFNYGLYLKKQPLIAGLWFRHFVEGSDAVIVLVGYEYDKFKFGYSYDITTSELADGSGGAHEVSFGLMFNCPQRKKRLNEINCPTF